MRLRFLILAVAVLIGVPSAARAGVFTDDLSRCLVSGTSDQDRTDLARWFFAMMALHPEVKSLAAVSEEVRTETTRKAGKLFERLLTETCKKEFRDAMKNEGQIAMTTSFQALGNVAGMALVQHPDVVGRMADLDRVVDREKIEAVLKNEP